MAKTRTRAPSARGRLVVEQGQIRPIHPFQLLMNMMSLCVFPFVGKPLLQVLSGMDDEQFISLMEERKALVPQFIIQALEL